MLLLLPSVCAATEGPNVLKINRKVRKEECREELYLRHSHYCWLWAYSLFLLTQPDEVSHAKQADLIGRNTQTTDPSVISMTPRMIFLKRANST